MRRAIVLLLALAAGCAPGAARTPSWCFAANGESPPAPFSLVARTQPSTRGVVTVDAVNGAAPRANPPIAASTPIAITGWAVDSAAGTAAQVFVRVDGGPLLRADSCGARADVAQALGSAAYAPSGFAVRLPPLHAGRHRIVFSTLVPRGGAFDADAAHVDIVTRGPDAPPPIAGSIDFVDGAPIALNPILHRRDMDVRLSGWLAQPAPEGYRPVRSLDVLVDGRLVDHASYGRRPAPGATHTGYSVRFPGDGLRPGLHNVVLLAHLPDGRTVRSPQVVELNVVAPPAPPAPAPAAPAPAAPASAAPPAGRR